jgi:hypothetical protein
MGGLLSKVFLVDLFRGLWVTFRNQNPKYIYTERYPTERPKDGKRGGASCVSARAHPRLYPLMRSILL